MGERRVCNANVVGSSPSTSTFLSNLCCWSLRPRRKSDRTLTRFISVKFGLRKGSRKRPEVAQATEENFFEILAKTELTPSAASCILRLPLGETLPAGNRMSLPSRTCSAAFSRRPKPSPAKPAGLELIFENLVVW